MVHQGSYVQDRDNPLGSFSRTSSTIKKIKTTALQEQERKSLVPQGSSGLEGGDS